MRRFTDPLLFGVLFLVTTVIWWIAAVTHNVPGTADDRLAPMTLVVFCIIATPAFAVATLLALFRSVFKVPPKAFWSWVTGAAIVAGVVVYVAQLITDIQKIQVGFGTTVWFAAALAFCALIGLVLALTGALSIPDAKVEPSEAKKSRLHRKGAIAEAPTPAPAPASIEPALTGPAGIEPAGIDPTVIQPAAEPGPDAMRPGLSSSAPGEVYGALSSDPVDSLEVPDPLTELPAPGSDSEESDPYSPRP